MNYNLSYVLNKDIFILYQRVQLNITLFLDFKLKLLFPNVYFSAQDVFFTGVGIITEEFFFNIDFLACNFELFTKLLDIYYPYPYLIPNFCFNYVLKTSLLLPKILC